mgnify:CR=1 FL=1
MALVRVRFKSGKESIVSELYVQRWPEDIDSILEPTDALVASTPEPTPVKESPKSVAPAKEKNNGT